MAPETACPSIRVDLESRSNGLTGTLDALAAVVDSLVEPVPRQTASERATGCHERVEQPRTTLTARERLAFHGSELLSDQELLTVILGTGYGNCSVTKLAQQLLESAGGLVGLHCQGMGRLAQVRGLGVAKSARLVAAFELGKRVQVQRQSKPPQKFDSFEAVAAWATPRLGPLMHEEVWLLGLNGQNGLAFARLIARGGMHACALTAKEVLRPAIAEGASAIVLVHNHPSGDPTPSRQDVLLTEVIDAAARCIDLPLLDHVVVATEGARSVRELMTGRPRA